MLKWVALFLGGAVLFASAMPPQYAISTARVQTGMPGVSISVATPAHKAADQTVLLGGMTAFTGTVSSQAAAQTMAETQVESMETHHCGGN